MKKTFLLLVLLLPALCPAALAGEYAGLVQKVDEAQGKMTVEWVPGDAPASPDVYVKSSVPLKGFQLLSDLKENDVVHVKGEVDFSTGAVAAESVELIS